MTSARRFFDREISAALGIPLTYHVSGRGELPSVFPVTDLACAAIGAVGAATAALVGEAAGTEVNTRLASLWCRSSIAPTGWQLPPVWDAIAGDYRTADGWIKLHTNLPHHRAAALSVLQTAQSREAVAGAVARYRGNDLESAIVEAGGVAAVMRSMAEWAQHPQGIAVGTEPLIGWDRPRMITVPPTGSGPSRPLAGIRVLDLTRVLAGPVATRTLAGLGAQVLRIDPPGWEEANVEPDITLGKRCAALDLRKAKDRHTLLRLLKEAHVFIHGYRPGALTSLGLGQDVREAANPDLIDVSLTAYGWTGPWAGRRGFDSLVQMSSGIAHAGMVATGADQPTPLPVQMLDHATGYLMAAAAITALFQARQGQPVGHAQLSLARTAHLLTTSPGKTGAEEEIGDTVPADFDPHKEQAPWGPAKRLLPPLSVGGTPLHWGRPATRFGSGAPEWL